MSDTSPTPDSPSLDKPTGAAEDEVKDPNELSEEEQMEKFAEQLKEDDWGHQPC